MECFFQAVSKAKLILFGIMLLTGLIAPHYVHIPGGILAVWWAADDFWCETKKR